MKLTLVFLVCLNSVFGDHLYEVPFGPVKLTNESLSVDSRVYGGNEAEEGQFPYMVMAFMRLSPAEIFRCSASRVAKDWVLLASHCIMNGMTEKDLILVAGKAKLADYVNARLNMSFDTDIEDEKFNTEERRAKRVFRHPDYVEGQYHDDIALIELKTPFTDKVPILKISRSKKERHENCTIHGWGLSEGDQFNGNLKYAVDEKAVTPSVGCSHKDAGNFYCLENNNKGICKGDSGSPLVCEGMAWGVASHLVTDDPNIRCGRSLEEYYTEIYPYKSWLDLYLPNASSPLSLSGTVLFTIFMCWFVNTF
ncbi:hypothetical protein RUM44_009556 [Polyplax serrata]|uniref:Peptidase S1 domain-containing protein n=1 Tax=Polyplax serrata TaxID=468196 RepID=A0ABR1AT18_POLSC